MWNLSLKVTHSIMHFLKVQKLQFKGKVDLLWMNFAIDQRNLVKTLIMKPGRMMWSCKENENNLLNLVSEAKEELCKRDLKKRSTFWKYQW